MANLGVSFANKVLQAVWCGVQRFDRLLLMDTYLPLDIQTPTVHEAPTSSSIGTDNTSSLKWTHPQLSRHLDCNLSSIFSLCFAARLLLCLIYKLALPRTHTWTFSISPTYDYKSCFHMVDR